MPNYKNIVFDLDGTISDSREGIIKGFRYALDKMNVCVCEGNDFQQFIGAPLTVTLKEHFFKNDAQKASLAVTYYREYYNKQGKYENTLYPGIKELLHQLKKEHNLFVLTNKIHVFAVEIIDYFELTPCFKSVHGLTPGSPETKIDLAKMLNQTIIHDNRTLMIGDTLFDVECAKTAGWESCFVTYGYGHRDSLVNNKPNYIVESVHELSALLIK